MTTTVTELDQTKALEAVDALERELASVREDFERRLKALEARLAAAPAPKPKSELTDEVVAIIAAAVTAFLGKKVKVRSARMVSPGSNSWAQQGRAFLQASHNLR